MVDTIRTTTDLLTNVFQDGQAADSITPQDIRDLIVSDNVYGGIAVSGTPTGQAVTATVFLKIDQFDANLAVNKGVTVDHATDRITITNDGDYRIVGVVSGQSSVNNTEVEFNYYVNGVQSGAQAHMNVGIGLSTDTATLLEFLSLVSGDYIELFMATDKNATITIINGCVTVERMG